MNGWQSIDAPGQNKPVVPEPNIYGAVLMVVLLVALFLNRKRK